MATTLVVVGHPDLGNSVANKRWIAELEQHPDRFTVHKLHELYPDGVIDVDAEQRLIESHDNLVLQFPVYWFSCPPLMKTWIDKVFTFGWAYGTQYALKDKKFGIAVSFGGASEGYARDGAVGYTAEETLRPFNLTANYIRAAYQPIFAFYGFLGGDEADTDAQKRLDSSAADYLAHLTANYS